MTTQEARRTLALIQDRRTVHLVDALVFAVLTDEMAHDRAIQVLAHLANPLAAPADERMQSLRACAKAVASMVMANESIPAGTLDFLQRTGWATHLDLEAQGEAAQ